MSWQNAHTKRVRTKLDRTPCCAQRTILFVGVEHVTSHMSKNETESDGDSDQETFLHHRSRGKMEFVMSSKKNVVNLSLLLTSLNAKGRALVILYKLQYHQMLEGEICLWQTANQPTI